MSYAHASNWTRLKFCRLIQGYGSLIYLYCFSHQIVRDDHDKLEEQKKWLDTEVEKVVQQRKEMEFLQEVGALVFYCSPNRSPHIYRSTYLLLPNPFPNKPWVFICLQHKSFENIVGKGEIVHSKRFLPFPTVFFYPFGELSATFIKFEIVVCKLFQFGTVKNLSFGKGLKDCELHFVFETAGKQHLLVLSIDKISALSNLKSICR